MLGLTRPHIRFLRKAYGLSQAEQCRACVEVWESINGSARFKAKEGEPDWAHNHERALQAYISDPRKKVEDVPFPPLFLLVSRCHLAQQHHDFLWRVRAEGPTRRKLEKRQDSNNKAIRAIGACVGFLFREAGTPEFEFSFLPTPWSWGIRKLAQKAVMPWGDAGDPVDSHTSYLNQLRDALRSENDYIQQYLKSKRGFGAAVQPPDVKHSALGIAQLVRENAQTRVQPNKRACEILATWEMDFTPKQLKDWREQASRTGR